VSAPTTETNQGPAPSLRGYLVEFDSPEALLAAARKVREEGFTKWDTFSPFPVHGMERAMGIRATRLPLLVLGGGVTGAVLGRLLQWWTNAHDYPFRISGKPFDSLPASIPVMFELTILLAAFGAFLGMLALNGLPRFYHPVFRSARFARVTDDRFFLAVDADDPRFDRERTRAFLASLGGTNVEDIDE
jgi:hypothetical protein